MQSKDKVIILMALMDMGVMLAKLSGRLKQLDEMGEEEDSYVRQNTINIQSVVATMLGATKEEIEMAMEMSESIPTSIVNMINDISGLIKNEMKKDNDDSCDLDGLKDLLN